MPGSATVVQIVIAPIGNSQSLRSSLRPSLSARRQKPNCFKFSTTNEGWVITAGNHKSLATTKVKRDTENNNKNNNKKNDKNNDNDNYPYILKSCNHSEMLLILREFQLFKWTLSQQLRKGKAACRGLTACVSWNDVDDFGMPIKSYGDSGSCQHTHTHTNARRRQVRFVKLAQ